MQDEVKYFLMRRRLLQRKLALVTAQAVAEIILPQIRDLLAEQVASQTAQIASVVSALEAASALNHLMFQNVDYHQRNETRFPPRD